MLDVVSRKQFLWNWLAIDALNWRLKEPPFTGVSGWPRPVSAETLKQTPPASDETPLLRAAIHGFELPVSQRLCFEAIVHWR